MLSKFFRKLKKDPKINENVKVDKTMRDYSNEEFFLKKKAMAEESLRKYGLPKELTSSK